MGSPLKDDGLARVETEAPVHSYPKRNAEPSRTLHKKTYAQGKFFAFSSSERQAECIRSKKAQTKTPIISDRRFC
ncbi:hypothetical protein VRB36_08300 [Pseudomonas poae]|uniref:Uncharacterized protein n=1 Tax=Pseudomonas poae TaxID=200451 RepID=A0AAP2S116_9PSED|nr:hypothetical protein [Pseudomonas poae]MCF5655568.1 hypothetical protein [Pseudomonas poae]MCF5778555.1 hypothetical protein [Pseudomonas poae]